MKHPRTHLLAAALACLAAACSTDDPKSDGAPPAHGASAANAGPGEPMAQASDKAEVGKPAPDFTLEDLAGKQHKLSQYKGKIVVLEWFSPGCPTCKWAYDTGPLVDMPEKMTADGVVWLSINSDDPQRSSASAKSNQAFVDEFGMKAPILFDPTGAVGRAYGAKTTPHMYVIDAEGKLRYMGGLDNAPNGRVKGGGEHIDYVGDAVAAVKAGKPVKDAETKSYG